MIANWRGRDSPATEKMQLYTRNNWRKVQTRAGTCGNLGDPGC